MGFLSTLGKHLPMSHCLSSLAHFSFGVVREWLLNFIYNRAFSGLADCLESSQSTVWDRWAFFFLWWRGKTLTGFTFTQ